jgi:RHH-type proline utilization regulon transcriptional repressor/proline dehydrogenase/delta 1-pyrroline-5-carboxylate dehydrogenase
VVADVASAFSAGQRCSALRVLCLQEEIADRVIRLTGATARLRRRPAPARYRRRPVIDADALAMLGRTRRDGPWRACCAMPTRGGMFFAPP